jgi:hypothetical protein
MNEPAVDSASVSSERRTAACIKACEGVPTNQLEDGIFVRLVAACVHVEDPRIREIMDELVPPRPRLALSSTPPRADD